MRFLAESLFGMDKAEARDRVPYLPNYYPPERQTVPAGDDGETVDVGCFGAIRSFKNHVGQAIAAMMFAGRIGRRLRFHINGDRLERGGHAVSHALDAIFDASPTAELIRHDWIPIHSEFLKLVAEMDLVAQVSFAETFNIVGADAASQGVPLVGSAEIPWISPLYRANPTDTEDMARVMHRAWELRFENRVVNPNRLGLKDYSWRSRERWLAYLNG